MSEVRDFTLDGYGRLLDGFESRGYVVRDFLDCDPGRAHLILRHDVDMSLAAAHRIARLEADRGLRASYFVLLRTDLYNPLSKANGALIAAIRELGHHVRLHFDASFYDDSSGDIEDRVARECDILETLCGASVDIVSFHRPVPALLQNPKLLAGRRHTYEPAFTDAVGYCSDSRGDWHRGHPFDHRNVCEERALQLLTHPIWWAGDGEMSNAARILWLLEEKEAVTRQALAENCEPFRRILAVES